jgi:tetratricopeptide (TPR) repeat protein
MSLLLDALKKAELAKQRATSADAVQDPAPTELSATVITREKLPDIGQHVEILSDDLPSARALAGDARGSARAQPLELTMSEPEPPVRPDVGRSERPPVENQEAARRLFEIKEIDYNPRRPFYLTLAALALVAAAYGGYVWWQLQPRYAYSAQAARETKDRTAALQKPSPVAPAAPAPAIATAPAPASVPVGATPPSRTANAVSTRASTPAVPAPAAPIRRPAQAQPNRSPVSTPTAQLAAQLAALGPPPGEPAGAGRQSIAINPATMQVDPQLERAYDAVQRNDLDTAREIYQGVLQRDPNSHDALLGMAAVDVRTRNYETAEARYLRLLELDPRDGYAHAGLLALRQADPVASESRLKNLLAGHPDSPQLLFALGNQYALQSRWSEAQQAFFRALSADPENPDYAFNLAVSLDHLHQRPQALEFYRRSLALADRRSATFDRSLAAARARELQPR